MRQFRILTSSNIKLYIEHIIKLHQRKPIVTDTRSKKISNTLQVNEADSFGIKSTPHRKYNKVSSQRAKTHCNPIYPFSSPYIYIYINRIKFRVFILFHILQKNIGRKTGTSENHLHQIFLSSLYSSGKKKIYIPATRNPERVQLYQNHGLFPSWRKNYFLTYSVTSRSILVAFFFASREKSSPARLRHF